MQINSKKINKKNFLVLSNINILSYIKFIKNEANQELFFLILIK